MRIGDGDFFPTALVLLPQPLLASPTHCCEACPWHLRHPAGGHPDQPRPRPHCAAEGGGQPCPGGGGRGRVFRRGAASWPDHRWDVLPSIPVTCFLPFGFTSGGGGCCVPLSRVIAGAGPHLWPGADAHGTAASLAAPCQLSAPLAQPPPSSQPPPKFTLGVSPISIEVELCCLEDAQSRHQ